MIAVVLEPLGNGQARAKVTVSGTIAAWKDGPTDQGKALLSSVLRSACVAHQIDGDRYDLTHIEMNAAAAAAWHRAD